MNTMMNIIMWFGSTMIWFIILPALWFFLIVTTYAAIADYQDWKELTLQDAERDNHDQN